jgi:hypothetical protein
VRRAIDLYAAGGWPAIKPAARGRSAGDGRLLSEEQEASVRRTICDKRPEQLKMEFALWTRGAVAICCLGQWPASQIVETYALTQAECIRCLARLDKLGLIVLRPVNSYRMQVSLAFHWRPNGPAQQFMRQRMVPDYFAGSFDQPGEAVMCVPARLGKASAQEAVHQVRQLAAELARLQQQDRRLNAAARDGYTLMVGLRCWEFSAFTALRRAPPPGPPGARYQNGPRKT